MTEEFHKPFIKSLLLVAFVTVVAMVSSRYVVNYYYQHNFVPQKTIEYSSIQSYTELQAPDIK